MHDAFREDQTSEEKRKSEKGSLMEHPEAPKKRRHNKSSIK
jgi:hypothetical protein